MVKLDAILSQSAEAIVLCDSQGRVLEASRLARQLCEGDPVSRPFSQVFPLVCAVPGTGKAKSWRAFAPDFSAAAGPVTALKVWHSRAGGQPLEFRFDLAPIELEGGGTGWVVTLAGRIRDLALRRKTASIAQPSPEQLRKLASRLLQMREAERAAIAREIHDSLAPDLTRFKLDLAWLERRLESPLAERDRPAILEKLAGMRQLSDAVIGAVQRIASDLRPPVLDSLGLGAAIEWQVRDFEARAGVRCELQLPAAPVEMEPDRATALFRILQESLTNVARHARAKRVTVSLAKRADAWVLKIEDDGQGLPSAKLADPRSAGLLGMRERAALLGGKCDISSHAGRGTKIQASLPINS